MNRGELKTRFKSIIDDVSDNTFDAARIEDLLYEGAQAVQHELELRVNDLFGVVFTQSVLASSTMISLPDKCNRVLTIWRTDLTKPIRFIKTTLQNLYELHRSKYYYATTGSEIRYALPLDEDHTVDIIYSKLISNLSQDTESWSDIPEMAHTLITYEAAMLALASEESAIEKIIALYAKRKNNILALLTPRDISSMRQVKEVY